METVRFFDWVVECSARLPDLDGELAWGSPDLRVRLDDRGPTPDPGAHWRAAILKRDGTPSVEALREGDVLWIRFPGLAHFRAGPEEGLLAGIPSPGVPAETLLHLVTDVVLPGLRCRRGRPVLRGAAVLDDGGAILFVGPEGSGRSTLAAALVAKGLPLVGDDLLALDATGEVSRVTGTLTVLRLWPDSPALKALAGAGAVPVASHTSKLRVDPAKAGLKRTGDPVPVRRIHLLPPRGGPGAVAVAVGITPLPPREAAAALSDACFLLDPGDGAALRERCQRPPVSPLLPLARRLSFPFGGERLDEVVEAGLRDARN